MGLRAYTRTHPLYSAVILALVLVAFTACLQIWQGHTADVRYRRAQLIECVQSEYDFATAVYLTTLVEAARSPLGPAAARLADATAAYRRAAARRLLLFRGQHIECEARNIPNVPDDLGPNPTVASTTTTTPPPASSTSTPATTAALPPGFAPSTIHPTVTTGATTTSTTPTTTRLAPRCPFGRLPNGKCRPHPKKDRPK